MLRLVINNESTIPVVAERSTYLRTLGAIFQGTITSPWVSNEYLIMPFWPVGIETSPWKRSTVATPQTWEASTLVFRNDLVCRSMDLANMIPVTHWTPTGGSVNETLFFLKSHSGCQYNLTLSDTQSGTKTALSWWGDIGNLTFSDLTVDDTYEVRPLYNDACHGDETIILSKLRAESFPEGTIGTFPSDTSMVGYVCYSNHTVATLPVTASVSETMFTVDFDKNEFRQNQQEMPKSLFSLSELHSLYTDKVWLEYIPSPLMLDPSDPRDFSGAGALLGANYAYNITRMMSDVSLPDIAASIRRRVFAEVLRSSLEAPGATRSEQIVGKMQSVQRRITVSPVAAYVISTLFFISFGMLLLVTWLSRVRWRPLNLAHDPASVLGITSLVVSDASVLLPLRGLDQTSKKQMVAALRDTRYSTSPGRLFEVQKQSDAIRTGKVFHFQILLQSPRSLCYHRRGTSTAFSVQCLLLDKAGLCKAISIFLPFHSCSCMFHKEYVIPLIFSIYTTSLGSQLIITAYTIKAGSIVQNWIPTILKRRTLFAFFVYLISLVVAITVLNRFANRSSLYQSAFTHQTNVALLGRLGSFAPFSILPTLFAVALGLWWDGIDKNFRILQPFVSMSRAPTKGSKGIYLSYQSSYWLWACAKAASNKHWLLTITTLGTFLSQARKFYTVHTSPPKTRYDSLVDIANHSFQSSSPCLRFLKSNQVLSYSLYS